MIGKGMVNVEFIKNYWRKRYKKIITAKLKAQYEVDDWWRSAWTALANKREPGRLETKQEYILERASDANYRIKKLMDAYDRL
jgi:hypothetical protein